MKIEVRSAVVGAVLVIAGGAAGVFGMNALGGPKTYDECFLDEMRGQPNGVMFSARQVCLAKFPEAEPQAGPNVQKLLSDFQ